MRTSQRPSSIKTRIKTPSCWLHTCSCRVRDHLPLKQGLRLHCRWRSASCHARVRDHLPLKQGLRLSVVILCYLGAEQVRDHLPLKQGLRLDNVLADSIAETGDVRDHLPLKQGLRHSLSRLQQRLLFRQRPSSIKTRIKTHLRQSKHWRVGVSVSETIFH